MAATLRGCVHTILKGRDDDDDDGLGGGLVLVLPGVVGVVVVLLLLLPGGVVSLADHRNWGTCVLLPLPVSPTNIRLW